MNPGSYLLGIDAGHSSIKAAVFDARGTTAGAAQEITTPFSRTAGWQEHDMDTTWDLTAAAVRRAIADSGIDPADIGGVGISAHGDGLYLVDERHRPVRPAILATDTRASIRDPRMDAAAADALLRSTGQLPAPYCAGALLAWLQQHEPAALGAARWVLHCKDWIGLRLTGAVRTDATDAAGLTDHHTGEWSDVALRLWGVGGCRTRLPDIRPSHDATDGVTADAAAMTGLRAGTPVVVGAHDVHAAALGIGALEDGALSSVIGTFNINQIATRTPRIDPHWQVRRSLRPGLHLHVSSSAAGAIAMEWLRDVTGQATVDIDASVTDALTRPVSPSDALFVPFLYGGPPEAPSSGALLNLAGWTSRTDLVRAGLEGVVYAHRLHLEALTGSPRGAHPGTPLRLTGGGSRNRAWTQLFADATGYTVEVTDTDEAGARGAAMLAGLGVGLLEHPDVARRWITVARRHTPERSRGQLFDVRYRRWAAAITALRGLDTSDD